jgi:putative transposase
VHGWFQRFVSDGVLEEIWAAIAAECEALGDLDWSWQAVDGMMGKARMGGGKRGSNPTDRAKQGTKKSLHVERSGGPLGLAVSGANVHDTKLLAPTLEATVIGRPDPEALPQHLCLDKAYDNPTGTAACGPAAISPTFAGSARRSSTMPARSAIPHGAGWSSALSPGSRSAARSSSATTRSRRTTKGSSSLPARFFGHAAYTGSDGAGEFSDSY